MKLYSSTFLNDSYLKYVGWMMYDKVIGAWCLFALMIFFPLLVSYSLVLINTL